MRYELMAQSVREFLTDEPDLSNYYAYHFKYCQVFKEMKEKKDEEIWMRHDSMAQSIREFQRVEPDLKFQIHCEMCDFTSDIFTTMEEHHIIH